MAHKAPGKHYREGITLVEMMRRFPDGATAEAWFTENRWLTGPVCPKCGSTNIQSGTKHKTMSYRCRSCRKYFSFKTGTVMEGSKLGAQIWLIASYLLTTGLKGQASMKLHRDLGITQKTAWHLAHRIRETWPRASNAKFSGPVKVDETYVGGLEKNKHAKKKLKAGRGGVGKTAVVGTKDRSTGQIHAKTVMKTDKKTLCDLVKERVESGSQVFTDDFSAYQGIPFDHKTVKHSAGEYVEGETHTNGIEGFWAMFKRGFKGTYHRMSEKRLDRYVTEFTGRHNVRCADTMDQMTRMAPGMVGKRLKYDDLVGD